MMASFPQTSSFDGLMAWANDAYELSLQTFIREVVRIQWDGHPVIDLSFPFMHVKPRPHAGIAIADETADWHAFMGLTRTPSYDGLADLADGIENEAPGCEAITLLLGRGVDWQRVSSIPGMSFDGVFGHIAIDGHHIYPIDSTVFLDSYLRSIGSPGRKRLVDALRRIERRQALALSGAL
jgi:hypothetical protein